MEYGIWNTQRSSGLHLQAENCRKSAWDVGEELNGWPDFPQDSSIWLNYAKLLDHDFSYLNLQFFWLVLSAPLEIVVGDLHRILVVHNEAVWNHQAIKLPSFEKLRLVPFLWKRDLLYHLHSFTILAIASNHTDGASEYQPFHKIWNN